MCFIKFRDYYRFLISIYNTVGKEQSPILNNQDDLGGTLLKFLILALGLFLCINNYYSSKYGTHQVIKFICCKVTNIV